jgi:hypothetical protein
MGSKLEKRCVLIDFTLFELKESTSVHIYIVVLQLLILRCFHVELNTKNRELPGETVLHISDFSALSNKLIFEVTKIGKYFCRLGQQIGAFEIIPRTLRRARNSEQLTAGPSMPFKKSSSPSPSFVHPSEAL